MVAKINQRTAAAHFYDEEEEDWVGKALSEEHAAKMWDHKGIKPVMNKEGRLRAVGTVNDFPEDAMAIYMTKYAEEIFEPKRILDEGDWLESHREPD